MEFDGMSDDCKLVYPNVEWVSLSECKPLQLVKVKIAATFVLAIVGKTFERRIDVLIIEPVKDRDKPFISKQNFGGPVPL
jgi:hypothetical protein